MALYPIKYHPAILTAATSPSTGVTYEVRDGVRNDQACILKENASSNPPKAHGKHATSEPAKLIVELRDHPKS